MFCVCLLYYSESNYKCYIHINIRSLNYLKGLNKKPHLSADSVDYEGLVSLTRNDLSKRNGDQGLRWDSSLIFTLYCCTG